GPCPPIGRHRYFHRLYALDITLDLKGATKSQIERAMQGHVLANESSSERIKRATGRHRTARHNDCHELIGLAYLQSGRARRSAVTSRVSGGAGLGSYRTRVMLMNRPSKPTRRRFLLNMGILAAAGWEVSCADVALAAQELAATPSCRDGDEPTVRETEGPFFKTRSPERGDLREPGSRGHQFE